MNKKQMVDRLQKLYDNNSLSEEYEITIQDLIVHFGSEKDLNW